MRLKFPQINNEADYKHHFRADSRLAPEAANYTLAELEAAIWRFCD